MNLVIDTGNTFTKIGVFDNDILIYTNTISCFDICEFEALFLKYSIKNSIHSAVSERDNEICFQLCKHCNHLNFTNETPVPIEIGYSTPKSLGRDRIAGIVGAYTIFPKTNVLVIDAGSAITFDFLTENSVFVGGNISPGIQMRFKALNKFTDKLPLMDIQIPFEEFGTSTANAIVSGVQRGIISEVEAYISQIESQFEKYKIIITGGDTFFFDKTIKKTIFAEPFLVLKGLNRIIKYNA